MGHGGFSLFRGQGSGVKDQGSEIRDQGSAEACSCTFFHCVVTERNYLQNACGPDFSLMVELSGK